MPNLSGFLTSLFAAAVFVTSATDLACAADDDVDELAKKVSNPAAYMISVPVHGTFDFGRIDGKSYSSAVVDVEPVIPFSLTEDWNVIVHTDFPFAYLNPPGGLGNEAGLGDISQDFLFTPSSHGSFVWAVGPQLSYPTATRDEFGSGKLSMGPSGLLLWQSTSMTTGLTASHIWSVVGEEDRPDVSRTELRPFVAWHLGRGRTISAGLDGTYDWTAEEVELPLSLSVSQIVKVGDQAVSLSVGGKYWLAGPDDGPRWGLKAGMTFLFPGVRE